MANTDSSLTQIYDSRFSAEERSRMRAVWKVLVEGFFQRFIDEDAVVLDMGAGDCGFINAVRAGKKIAVDANPAFLECADPDVEKIISDELSLSMLEDSQLTHVFLSNFLEHLANSNEVIDLLKTLRRKLKPGGSVMVLQPNYRLVGHKYFDFIDHKVILTEKSLIEALETAGFSISYLKVRFLPYTSKSSLPKAPWLVSIYLKLPIFQYFMGGQTFVVAKATYV